MFDQGDRARGGVPTVSWGLPDMLRAMLAALILVAAGIGLVVVVGFAFTWLGLPSPPQSARVLVIFALEAVLILPAWLWGPRKYGGGWASLGLGGFSIPRAGLLLMLCLPLILVINVAWDAVRRQIGFSGQPDFLPLFGEGVQGLLVALVLGGVVAPVAEEIFFRGYLYAGLRERLGVAGGLLVSSLLFAGVHLVPGVLPPIFVMGLLFALLYEATASIWPSIILHGAINAMAFIAAYVAQNMPELLPSMG